MKTKLTLQASSMLFFSNVNLLRDIPVEVDSDVLSVSDIKNINKYIQNGSIVSTEGFLPEQVEEITIKEEDLEKKEEILTIPTKEIVEEIKVEQKQESVENTVQVKEDLEAKVEVEKTTVVKKPVTRKAPTRKK